MNQQALIERVVAEVMGQLMTRSAAPVSEPARRFVLKETVITADLLAESASGQAVIEVTQKAIVTPSARDWLKQNKVEVIRAPRQIAGATTSAVQTVGHLAIIQSGGENVDRVLKSLNWKRELAGTADEAAKLAISEVCRGGVNRLLIFSREAEVAVCLANRNEKVRAATVTDVAGVKRVKSGLGANVFVIDPADRGFFELRNVVKQVQT